MLLYIGSKTALVNIMPSVANIEIGRKTNGIESFWALLKRGLNGTHHHVPIKHLGSYVNEFAHRHNVRELPTIEAMGRIVTGLMDKRLTYKELTV